MTDDSKTPAEDGGGLVGSDGIIEVMQWIQVSTLGDPEKMEELFRTRGIDPSAFAEAGGIMVAVAVSMNQAPEDAVQAAFMTGGLLGAFLGRDYFTTEQLPETE